jgi:hypothetical protein
MGVLNRCGGCRFWQASCVFDPPDLEVQEGKCHYDGVAFWTLGEHEYDDSPTYLWTIRTHGCDQWRCR